MRIAVWLLLAVGLVGTAAFTAAASGLGDPTSDGFEVLYVCLHVLSGTVCLLRVALVRRERLALGALTEFLIKGRITPEDFERHVIALLERLTRSRTAGRDDELQAHPVG